MSEYSGISGVGSDSAAVQRNAPNFSRPQPQHSAMKSGRKTNADRHVHIIDAFHDPMRDMPLQPRFSEESERTETTTSENSVGSEVGWDGHSGELDRSSRMKRYNDQRFTARDGAVRPPASRTNTGGSNASSRQTFEFGLPADSESQSYTSRPHAQIVKRVSVDQRSERISTSGSQWEDTASHHTASENGESGSIDIEGRWQSSDYDTSSLSPAEIRKLEKKGINPALYMEMKEAKKGKKKWVPHLLGNGFVN